MTVTAIYTSRASAAMLAAGLLPWSSLERMAARIAPLEWALGCVVHESTRRKMLVDNPAELYGF